MPRTAILSGAVAERRVRVGIATSIIVRRYSVLMIIGSALLLLRIFTTDWTELSRNFGFLKDNDLQLSYSWTSVKRDKSARSI